MEEDQEEEVITCRENAKSERATTTEDSSSFHDSDHPSKEFLEIFDALDPSINGELIEKAWKQYDTIGQQVILEGAKKAWMACAFYTTVFQSTPLGQEPIYKYSVHKLLNICNLSVLEFFEKLTKWSEMIVASRRLLDHINKVQASLAVSTVVYKKYLPIFRRVFANYQKRTTSTSKSKYASQLETITTPQLFELIWTMFIAFKKQFLASSDDLMNAFHLLLCIVELVFEDLRDAKLTHLYNADFEKLLLSNKYDSALDYFCETFEGVVLDAKHFRTHWLFPKLRKLADERVLFGSTIAGGILTSISANREAFDCLYEESMQKKSEIDERMLIASAMANIDTVFNETLDASAIVMLRRCSLDTNWAIDADLLLRMSTQQCLEKLNGQRAWQLPPAAKSSYVVTPEQFCPSTPLQEENSQKLKVLANLISVDFRHTDNEFDRLLSSCRDNPRSVIADQITILGDRLEKTVHEESVSNGLAYDEAFTTNIKQRGEEIELLFYRVLQQVVLHERDRSLNMGLEISEDIGTILHKPDFIGSLWTAALEIILFSHNSRRDFPWSSNVARVAPVNFYKIIELVIRAEPDLSRDIVRHLNKVEERVLEELAWTFDSPLWGALAKYLDLGVPSCRSVSLNGFGLKSAPPLDQCGFQQAHDAPTLVSRFNASPMRPYERIPIKRRLEYDAYGDAIVDDSEEIDPSTNPPRVKRAANDDGVPEFSEYNQNQQQTVLPSSLIVFFRKVYYVAAVRLTDLCDRVRIEDAGRQKVWTLFEHMLRNETSLMKGRHLDQNIMCCLYIVAKVCSFDTSFHDIMYHYRHQPQAVSRVYRRVLMDAIASPTTALMSDDGASRDSVSSVTGGKLRSSSALPTPDTASAPPTPEPHNLDYADLIKYYNRVFVGRVEDFVKRLNPNNNMDSKENLFLIPMPKVYSNTLSPRRLVNEQINVLPMSSFPTLPGRPARYSFNRSPSKDLRNINAMVRDARLITPYY